MLVDKVHMHLVNVECVPTSTKFNAIIDLEVDIGDLLPYLAAEIRGCTYIHGAGQLNFMDQGHIIAIGHRQITMTGVLDEAEAQQLCERFKRLINDVNQRRDSITPVLRKQARLGPLAVYRELPGTNCGECGEVTCMAFAALVVNRELVASKCAPLLLEEYGEKRHRLWEILRQAEYDLE